RPEGEDPRRPRGVEGVAGHHDEPRGARPERVAGHGRAGSMSEQVLVEEVRPHVALVTLNRPERLNALSWDLVDELHATLDRLERDNATRVVVLTGAGRGFCSGLDLQGGGTQGASVSEGLR